MAKHIKSEEHGVDYTSIIEHEAAVTEDTPQENNTNDPVSAEPLPPLLRIPMPDGDELEQEKVEEVKEKPTQTHQASENQVIPQILLDKLQEVKKLVGRHEAINIAIASFQGANREISALEFLTRAEQIEQWITTGKLPEEEATPGGSPQRASRSVGAVVKKSIKKKSAPAPKKAVKKIVKKALKTAKRSGPGRPPKKGNRYR